MKTLRFVSVILAFVGFLTIFAIVSTVDYEDEARIEQEQRMSSETVKCALGCGLVMMISGGLGYALSEKIAEEEERKKSQFERRKSRYRRG